MIGASIIAVIILILSSLINVVGYQTVQLSNEIIINGEVDKKELLFQTIVDIANNKEIQRIILKSQMSRGIFPTSEIPNVTKTQIRQMYFLCLILSKIVSKSRIQSIVGKYQLSNQGMQKKINDVIKKDVILNGEINQLSNSECDCENENTTGFWKFPVICLALNLLWWFFVVLYFVGVSIAELFVESIGQIAIDIDCFWIHY